MLDRESHACCFKTLEKFFATALASGGGLMNAGILAVISSPTGRCIAARGRNLRGRRIALHAFECHGTSSITDTLRNLNDHSR